MPTITYIEQTFSAKVKKVLTQANDIIAEYAVQGFDLTLRQIYYQFVARGFIANKQSEYKRLGDIINNGRLGGKIDWNAITDRTRNLRSQGHWETPADIIDSAANSFRLDKWRTQPFRVEVWIEKDALVGVLDAVCPGLDVPYFSCRGYVSQSEMWAAAQRLKSWVKKGQQVVILHLGDHDPSGIDMSRDIKDRLELFGTRLEVKRIALNMDQVEQYNPPPNPAKMTDARAESYVELYGDESWELDALDPAALTALIEGEVAELRDEDAWNDLLAQEEEGTRLLKAVSADWQRLTKDL